MVAATPEELESARVRAGTSLRLARTWWETQRTHAPRSPILARTRRHVCVLSCKQGRRQINMAAKVNIHVAAGEGNVGEVKAYLKAGGIIDKRDADRWTPLMLAVREGHIEVARQLLRSGASLEAKDGDKWTAMHVAAANGHPQCCQLLLDRGGNPRAVDENKRTPLHWAMRWVDYILRSTSIYSKYYTTFN